METINGITISTPMNNELLAYKEAGNDVRLCVPDGEPGPGCPNCNGTGDIGATIIHGGPYTFVPEHTGCMYVGGAWYKVKNVMFKCPLCSGNESRPSVIERIFEDSGLEEVEREWRLEYIENHEDKDIALGAARDMLSRIPTINGIMAFFGNYGVGKSGILKSMTGACARAGVRAKYMRASDVLTQLRSTYDNNGVSEGGVYNSLMRYKFLALDEIDRIADTDWAKAAIFSVLDKRYNARHVMATVLATNSVPDNMGPDWGYMTSRLTDGVRVPVGGQSLRGVQRQMNI